mgnify:CR=1 FL=1
MSISEPTANLEVNVFFTVTETNIQNSDTINGGIRNFELKDFNRPIVSDEPFSFTNTRILSVASTDVYANISGISNVLQFGETPGTNYTGNVMSILSVNSNIGSKFIFSNVNVDMGSIEFMTNVSRTSTATVISPNLTFEANAMVSNIVMDANQVIPDQTNILTIGDDFNITYYTDGNFSENFGGSNVITGTPGLLNSNVTIEMSDQILKSYINSDEFAFGRALLYQVDYNAVPSSETNININDIEPESNKLKLYANTLNYYSTGSFVAYEIQPLESISSTNASLVVGI